MSQHADSGKISPKIVADPLRDMPVGATLPIRPVVFGTSDAKIVPDDVKNWEFFDGALLAVGFGRDGGRIAVQGTAVMVAPGLAVTAAHVVRELAPALARGELASLCVGIRQGDACDLWRLQSVTMLEEADSDIAWLSLELCSEITDDWHFSTVAMTTRTPMVGEHLTIAGFRFEEGLTAGERDASPGRLIAASGEVVAVHNGRDRLLLPFPAIEIACGSHGAMSGGAVLDADGLLLGVISRGWDTDDNAGPTYAAWIPAALGMKVDVPWPPALYEPGLAILDLPPDLCRVDGREALNLIGDQLEWGYLVR